MVVIKDIFKRDYWIMQIQSFDWRNAMVYQQLYHALEIATIKLFSGCSYEAKSARFGCLVVLIKQ